MYQWVLMLCCQKTVVDWIPWTITLQLSYFSSLVNSWRSQLTPDEEGIFPAYLLPMGICGVCHGCQGCCGIPVCFAVCAQASQSLQGSEKAEVIWAAQHAGKILEGPKECWEPWGVTCHFKDAVIEIQAEGHESDRGKRKTRQWCAF